MQNKKMVDGVFKKNVLKTVVKKGGATKGSSLDPSKAIKAYSSSKQRMMKKGGMVKKKK